jgi:hypothetical protein
MATYTYRFDEGRVFRGDIEQSKAQGEDAIWMIADAHANRCARTLAVSELFRDRWSSAAARAIAVAWRHGVRAGMASLRRNRKLTRSAKRWARDYRARLWSMGPEALRDRGLARFIFGHSDFGTPPREQGAECRAPASTERELWEALDRLIMECHRQKLQPAMALTVAQHVCGRLRAAMRESGYTHASRTHCVACRGRQLERILRATRHDGGRTLDRFDREGIRGVEPRAQARVHRNDGRLRFRHHRASHRDEAGLGCL